MKKYTFVFWLYWKYLINLESSIFFTSEIQTRFISTWDTAINNCFQVGLQTKVFHILDICNVFVSGIWWFTFSGTYPNIFLLFLSTSCLISDIINYCVCLCVNPLGRILPVNDPASQKYKMIAKWIENNYDTFQEMPHVLKYLFILN